MTVRWDKKSGRCRGVVVSGSSTAFRNGQETLGREKRLVMLGRSLFKQLYWGNNNTGF